MPLFDEQGRYTEPGPEEIPLFTDGKRLWCESPSIEVRWKTLWPHLYTKGKFSFTTDQNYRVVPFTYPWPVRALPVEYKVIGETEAIVVHCHVAGASFTEAGIPNAVYTHQGVTKTLKNFDSYVDVWLGEDTNGPKLARMKSAWKGSDINQGILLFVQRTPLLTAFDMALMAIVYKTGLSASRVENRKLSARIEFNRERVD